MAKKTAKKTTKKGTKTKKELSVFDAIKAKMKGTKVLEMGNNAESLIPWKIPFKHKGLQKASGGLLGGKIAMYEAESQTGKSFLGYELIAEAVKMGGMGYLQDREQAYEPDYGAKAGLDDEHTFFYDDGILIEPSFKEWINWIKATREVIKDKSIPLVIVDDSFPVSRCEEQNKNDEGGKDTGYGSMKKNNAYYDKLAMLQPILAEYAVSLVIINQLTTDHTVLFGDKAKRKGPQLEYFCTQIIRGKKGKKLSVKRKLNTMEKTVQVGMTGNWQVVKNRFVEPMKKVEVKIFFRKGLAPWSGLGDLLVLEEEIKQKVMADPNDGRKKIKGYIVIDDENENFYPETEIKQMCKDFPKLLEPKFTARLDELDETNVVEEDFEDKQEE